MNEANHPSPGESGHEAPSRVAIPFLLRKLDELYDALPVARYTEWLIEAKISLQAGDYSKALQLVKRTRDLSSPPADRRPRPMDRRARKGASPEVLAGFDVVLRLLEPLADWHAQQLRAEAESARSTASSRAGRDGEPATQEAAEEVADDPEDQAKRSARSNLGRMGFTQLHNAAQRCGLELNVDQITVVCNRDVLIGQYERAFETIESLYVQFQALAAKRADDLRQEEIQYKAGTLKMSVKDWLIRRRQLAEQNQRIDRTRRYFTRVLDSLRVMRLSNPK